MPLHVTTIMIGVEDLARSKAFYSEGRGPDHGHGTRGSSITTSSRPMRSRSAINSISTIFPPTIVNAKTARGLPLGAHTAPGDPSTTANCAAEARPTNVLATAVRVRTSLDAPGGVAPGSARKTTSGSSNVSNASKSPPRDAARKAITTSRVPGRIGIWIRAHALYPAPAPAAQLAAHNRTDLIEGHREYVVQHDGEPFGRRQCVEDDEQRRPDGIGQHGLLFGSIGHFACHGRLGFLSLNRLLAPRLPGAKHVKAYPRHDGGEPTTEALHALCARAAESEPRLLDGVVSLVRRPEHLEGDGPKVGPLGLEFRCQPVVLGHRSHFLVSFRHQYEEWDVADVTRRSTAPPYHRPEWIAPDQVLSTTGHVLGSPSVTNDKVGRLGGVWDHRYARESLRNGNQGGP
jgi:hypothetical protein